MENKIIRVFPRRTNHIPIDELSFVGYPPLFRPVDGDVHISCLFTWDISLAKKLYEAWNQCYDNTKIGGPAFDDPGGEFTPGLYVRKGVTITSRGCPFKCEWCYVPKREGNLRLLKIHPGNEIQDNNLLACPDNHIQAVFDMLKKQKQIKFIGGLDARLLKSWHIKEFRKLNINSFFFAADYPNWKYLERVSGLMKEFFRDKKRCYVLIGYKDDTISEAEKRLEQVWDLDFLPFAQFYRGKGENKKTADWKDLQRMWSRPAATKAIHKEKKHLEKRRLGFDFCR